MFYPTRWSRGYLVAEDEYRDLRDDWRRLHSISGMTKLAAAVFIPASIVFVAMGSSGSDNSQLAAVQFAFALVFALVFGWRITKPHRLVWGRTPIAEKRSSRKADSDVARQLNWPLAVLLVVLSGWLVVVAASVAAFQPMIGVPLLLLFGWAAYRNFRIVCRKWFERTEQS